MKGNTMATDLIKEIEKQIVKTDSLFSVDESFNDERFMRVRIAAMHSGINRNNSSFSTDVIKAAKDTFANIPILADVQEYEDKNGNKYLDYSGHSMHTEQDAFNDENLRIIYDEKVVGIIPESNNFEIINDKETGNDYVYVDALLYREYGNYVCDILESRDNKTDVSMEIDCDDISYSAKDKCLVVNKMTACAITLLGEHVTPGMAKAHAEVFSMNNDDRQNQLIQIMQELKQSLDSYTVAFATGESTKGGNNKQMDKKFEELLKQYNKSIEDITFEYDGLSDEELEAKFVEIFEEPKKKLEDDDATATTEDENPEEDSKPVENEPTPTPEEPEEEPIHTPVEPENNDNTDDNSGETFESNNNCSIELDGVKREFAISLNDKQVAIDTLVNDTYGESDNDYFYSDVYEDSKTVVMHGLFSGKHYRQSYKEKKGVYSLSGDRVSVFAQYLTQDEIDKLDAMKSNYSSIEEKLAKYEAEPEKMQILESEEYFSIADKEEFIELKKQKNHFDLTFEELKKSADDIILAYAKKGSLTFSVKKESSDMKLPISKKKESRYGNLFSETK